MIGIFDSGLGGLTALTKLRKFAPDTDLIYFGDTARVPYGSRSDETITKYADDIIRLLIDKGADSILAACGTVSTVALPRLKGKYSVPVSGILEPACAAAAKATKNGKNYVTPFGSKMLVDGENGELLKEKNVPECEILLGVRPEHINLASAAAEDTIPGKVLVNEMMGSELHLHVTTEDGTKLICRAPTVELSRNERAQLKNGHAVNLTFPGKVMYFFDPETEKNLLF